MPRDLPSFPTRRSSDLGGFSQIASYVGRVWMSGQSAIARYKFTPPGSAWDQTDSGAYSISPRANQVADVAGNSMPAQPLDRKSTRLNSSHTVITYAVVC